MKKYCLYLIFSLLLIPALVSHAGQGKIIGEDSYTIPGWFKDSFLEIQEDIKEADENNRHVMLFMHIDRCPYCTRMLEENFRSGDISNSLRKTLMSSPSISAVIVKSSGMNTLSIVRKLWQLN